MGLRSFVVQDENLFSRLCQLQTLADFEFLLGRIRLQTFDAPLLLLHLAMQLLVFLFERLHLVALFDESRDAVGTAQLNECVHHAAEHNARINRSDAGKLHGSLRETIVTPKARNVSSVTDKIVVLSTCPSEEEAERVAKVLLEGHLAACVTLLPKSRSLYRWKGAIEDSSECVLLVKTSTELFPQLRDALEASHSYEVPEVVAIPIVAGSEKYLAWMTGELHA